jgi:hypothetical protein
MERMRGFLCSGLSALILLSSPGIGPYEALEARRLREAFERLSQGRTTLFFMDRREDVDGYDRVIVLEDGAVRMKI